MGFNILVVNAGSTSFKFQIIEILSEKTLAKGKCENIFSKNTEFFYQGKSVGYVNTETDGYSACLKKMLAVICDKNQGIIKSVDEINAVGFKAVMAGEMNYPAKVDEKVFEKLNKYLFAAPAHNVPYITVMKEMQKLLPSTFQAAVFETSFHNTIEKRAYTYPLNKEIAQKYGIRKYGFHGASHSYTSYVTQKMGFCRVISCHLGGSSSICAIKDGKSFDTSMGFSPQSGLAMNNRCGDIDVSALIYLMKKAHISLDEMNEILCEKSGLLGVSGISGDMRVLLENTKNPDCKTAVDMYVYEILKYIGSFAVLLGGADAITFSGGIGENSAEIRKMVCDALNPFGIYLDNAKNDELSDKIRIISSENSKVKIMVIPTNEELMVARKTYELFKEEV